MTSPALLLLCALQWALVNVPVATFRAEPRQGAEMETQAPMGTPLQVLDSKGEWRHVALPDSVEAWVNESALVELSDSAMHDWRKTRRAIVVSFDEAPGVVRIPSDSCDVRVTSLVNGSIVKIETLPAEGEAEVVLPDGRRCLVPSGVILDLEEWADGDCDVDRMISFAYSMLDTPYLWGGTSTKMNDCSGFTKICCADALRVMLPRNSRSQARVGFLVPENEPLQRGDLLFFLNPETLRVNHVGIYDRDGYFIHSSGTVHVNNLDPSHPLFSGKLFSHAVRLFDENGALHPDLVRYSSHPWYFDPQ